MTDRPAKYGALAGGKEPGVEMDCAGATSHYDAVDDKRTVYLQVVFLKVGEIDTVKECFAADVCIKSRWREPRLDGQVNTDEKSMKWTDFWHPRLYTDNTVGEPKEVISHSLYFNADKEAFICEQRRIKGTFLENLELYEFPFDTQDISLTMISEWGVDEVELEADPLEASSINKQSFVDEQEWNLYSLVETSKDYCSLLYTGSARERHPRMMFKCRAARRFGFYLWNICFVMFIICSMTFTTFSVDYKLPQNRLQLTFILLLTTVTFKFAVNQSLPRISYLTYLDKYILSSMSILVVICCWHAVVYAAIFMSGVGHDIVFWTDKWILVATGILYVAAHIAFFLFIYFNVIKRRRETEQLDHEFVSRTKTRPNAKYLRSTNSTA